jgi:hypothetical protein
MTAKRLLKTRKNEANTNKGPVLLSTLAWLYALNQSFAKGESSMSAIA